MKKTLLILFLWFAIISGVLAQTATQPEGSGSKSSPFKITSIENLYWISQYVASFGLNVYCIQTNDIDASKTKDWNNGKGFTPIGTIYYKYLGQYDGSGYSITGIFINKSTQTSTEMYTGLFGYVEDAIVKNLKVVNGSISGDVGVGGLIGRAFNSEISNCSFSGSVSGYSGVGGLVASLTDNASISDCYTTGSVEGDDRSGGICGSMNSSTISNSYSSCNVEVTTSTAGGIVANVNNNSVVTGCYSTGTVTGTGAGGIGGLVGKNSTNSSVLKSYSTGDVVTTGSSVGGFIGINDNNSKVINCYATGDVKGTKEYGGFVGTNSTASDIKNCYATGKIDQTGSNYGAFAGSNSSSTFTNCYWNNETSGVTTNVGSDDNMQSVTALSIAKMQSYESYSNWDFAGTDVDGNEEIWAIATEINNGYPFFFREIETPSIMGIGDISFSDISFFSAKLKSSVTNIGLPNPIDYGFCLSINNSIPTLADIVVKSGGISGGTTAPFVFSSNISDLLINTTYYICSYAINTEGIVYSDPVSFTTPGVAFSFVSSTVSGNLNFKMACNQAGTAYIDWGDGLLVKTTTGTDMVQYSTSSYTAGKTVNVYALEVTGINVSDCSLTNLEVSDSESLKTLICNNNNFTLVTLPPVKATYTTYTYAPQPKLTVDLVNKTDVDLSGQLKVTDDEGNIITTTYKWYTSENVEVNTSMYNESEGKFSFVQGFSEGVYCVMTNQALDDFTGDNSYRTNILYPVVSATGDGTEANPYKIATIDDLLWLSGTPAIWGKYFVQTADIDASYTSKCNIIDGVTLGFSPIGNESSKFTGNYKGNGHTISNLYINRPTTNYIGLFGNTNYGSISDVNLENVSVTGQNYVAGLSGYSDVTPLTNCHVSGDITGSSYVAGIAGCFSGYDYANPIKISQCSNSAKITSTGEYIGGITACIDVAYISQSYNNGAVICNADSDDAHAGGIIGFIPIDCRCNIYNCYNTGAVTALKSNYAGGIIGTCNGAYLNNCYNTGVVTAESLPGGIVGWCGENSDFEKCYTIQSPAIGKKNNTISREEISVVSKSYLLSLKNLTGWDFAGITTDGTSEVWCISSTVNSGLPVFLWQIATTAKAGISSVSDDNSYVNVIKLSSSITNLGMPNPADYGFCYSNVNTSPTIDDNYVSLGDIHGDSGEPVDFNSTIEGIDVNTDYYVTAYVRNAAGISYSNPLTHKATTAAFSFTSDITTGSIDFSMTCSADGTAYIDWGDGVYVPIVTATNNTLYSGSYSAGNSVKVYVANATAIDVSSRLVTMLDVSGCETLTSLICNNNKLLFTTLPPVKSTYVTYKYAPQAEITLSSNKIFDFSSQLTVTGINGNIVNTGYAWHNSDASLIEPLSYTGENGVYSFLYSFANGVYCALTNTAFPDFKDDNVLRSNLLYPYTTPDGEGTVTNPYKIATLGDLLWVSQTSASWSSYFEQTADIDASQTSKWNLTDGVYLGFSPIGLTTEFKGNYNGNKHTISNLYINRGSTDQVALFGDSYKAVIKNLGLINVDITGHDNVGAISGYSTTVTMSECFTSGKVSATRWVAGGITGVAMAGSLTNCYSTCDVTSNEKAGSLSGSNSKCKITNCYASGKVTSDSNAGSLLGTLNNSTSFTNNYWNTETSGLNVGIGTNSTTYTLTGLTSEQMRNINSFAGWDFAGIESDGTNDIWVVNTEINNGFPVFLWQVDNSQIAPAAIAPSKLSVFENVPGVDLSDDIQIVDLNKNNQTITFTITGGTLTMGTSGVIFGGNGNGSASFTASGDLTSVNNALDEAYFTPTPDYTGDASIEFISNNGLKISNKASVVFAISSVNNAPTLSATAVNATFTENGSSVDLFSNVTISTGESDQTITKLVVTVKDVWVNDATQLLIVDGSNIGLSDSNITTLINSMAVTVSLSEATNTATVTISKEGGVSEDVMESIIDNLAYINVHEDPITSDRIITLTSIQDNGGTENGGVDNTDLSIISSVAIISVNDLPIFTLFSGIIDNTTLNNEVEITFNELLDKSDAFDYESSISGFVVKSLTSGSLKIGPSAADATEFNSTTNCTINSGLNAYWTPETSFYGTANAFTTTVIAEDGNESTQAIQAQIEVIDETAPEVISITLIDTPAANSISVIFAVTFSETVNNVSIDDFSLITTGSASATITPISVAYGNTINVTVNSISGTGSLRLDVIASTNIKDASANLLSGSFTSGDVHMVNSEDPSVTLSISESSIAENNGLTTITASLSYKSYQDVTVNLTYSGTANASDYTNASSSIVIKAGSLSNITTIKAADDATDEYDESVIITISDVTNGSIAANSQITTYIIDDDDAPTISVSDASVTESDVANASLMFNVSLSASSEKTVTVDCATLGATAIAGADFTPLSANTITFNPGETNKNVHVYILDDLLDEDDNETLYLKLSNPGNVSVVYDQGSGVIIDNDLSPNLSINDITAYEGNAGSSNVTFTVTLDAPSERLITVDYASADNTAFAGSDYSAISGTITFDPGVTTKTISVTIYGDEINEGNESFGLNLSTCVNATISDMQGLCTINNDDPIPAITLSVSPASITEAGGLSTITATLSPASSKTVTVNIFIDATSSAGTEDYKLSANSITIYAGNTTGTATLTAVDNSYSEDNQTVLVNIGSATNAIEEGKQQQTITILDDELASVASVLSNTLNGYYMAGSNIQILVTFSFPVTVTGIPQLTLETGINDQVATYSEGSGSNTLLFNYMVVNGDMNNDLDYVSANSLSLNGGTIKKNGINALLILPTPGSAYSLGGNNDIVIDTQEPTSTINLSDTELIYGETAIVTFKFSESVNGFTNDDISAPNGSLTTVVTSDGGITYTATYTPNNATEKASNEIILDNTGVADFAGNLGVGNTISESFSIDTYCPEATYVTSSNDDGTYGIGKIIYIALSFNEVVKISGTPQLELETGLVDHFAGYISGSDSKTLIFSYTTQAGDESADLNYKSLNSLSLNNGTIKDITGNNAVLTLPDTDATGSLGINKAIIIEAFPSVTINVNAATISEDNGKSIITANLSEVSSQDVTVNLSYSGTAVIGTDYNNSASTSITIISGETYAETVVGITATNDNITESNEDIIVNVTNISKGVFTDSQQTITITDDDLAFLSVEATTQASEDATDGMFTITTNKQFDKDVNVTIVFTGDALSVTDYLETGTIVTFPAYSNSVSIPVEVIADNIVEGDETVTITLAATNNSNVSVATSPNNEATITITDNDVAQLTVYASNQASEDATNGAFTITTDKMFDDDVIVTLAVSGDAINGTDYSSIATSVTIPANSSSVTIPVNVIADNIVEGDETVTAKLTATDNNNVTIASESSASITISDNDRATLTVISNSDGKEGVDNGSFSIISDKMFGYDVTVTIAITGSAAEGSDYSVIGTAIIIPANTTTKTIDIVVVDDMEGENSETVILSLINTNNTLGDISAGSDNSATVNIIDNDIVQLEITTPIITSIKEYDGYATAGYSIGSLTNLREGDDVTVTGIANYDNGSVGTAKTITVSYKISGNDASLYLAPVDYSINDGVISEKIVLNDLVTPQATCEGNALELNYTIVTGEPTEYQIIFGSSATSAGFTDVEFTALTTTSDNGSVSIAIPEGLPYGTYTAELQFVNQYGFVSPFYKFSFTINLSSDYLVAKFNDVVLCNNSSNMFKSYQWYKDGVVITGANKQFYCDPKGLSGSYYVQVTTVNNEVLNTCPATYYKNTSVKAASLSIYPNPVKSGQTFKVEISDVDQAELEGAMLRVFSNQGQLVLNSANVSSINNITLNNVSSGVFIVRLYTASGVELSGKIILK